MDAFAVRRADRFAGAAFALLVQAGFLALLLFSRLPAAAPQNLVRELTLILPRLPKTEPTPAPSMPGRPLAAPPAPLLAMPQTLFAPPPMATPEVAPNLGQALFGCAPENYANLTPEKRALCPRPGEGVAVQDAPTLKDLPSQAKDEAHWKREWVRKETPPLLPGASKDNLGLSIVAIGGSQTSLLGGLSTGDETSLYDVEQPAQ